MFNQNYRDFVDRCAIDYIPGHPLVYAALELANEAGEAAGVCKKIEREGGVLAPLTLKIAQLKLDALDELGDTYWAFTRVCNLLGTTVEEVQAHNYAKLRKRHSEGYYPEAPCKPLD